MKRFLFTTSMMLMALLSYSQNPITLRFVRPSKFTGSGLKISVKLPNETMQLKNGGTLTMSVYPSYNEPFEVECTVPYGNQQAVYLLKPKPGESYDFEVGFRPFSGALYLELKGGAEARPGEVEALLPHLNDSTQWDTNLKFNRKAGGIGFTAETVDPSVAIRQQWLQKGGRVKYESTSLNGLYMSMDVEGAGTIKSYGGGVSMFYNHMNLRIPEYKTGLSTWSSFNWGYGLDAVLYVTKFNMQTGPITMNFKNTVLNYMFTANLGWTLGMGTFRGEANWKGVALLFKYRPSINLVMTSSTIKIKSTSPPIDDTDYDSDIDAVPNLGGFGFDLQFSNFYATMDKLAPMPAAKFSFFFLPPIGDSPLFISAGLGILIYKDPAQSRFKKR